MVTALFVLGVVFLVLKLAGIIAWTWWLVLLPFAPLAVAAALYLLAGLFFGVGFTIYGFSKLFSKNKS